MVSSYYGDSPPNVPMVFSTIGTKWCPRKLAELVNISPIIMVFVGDISIVFMGFINRLVTGGGTTIGTYSEWVLFVGDHLTRSNGL